MIKKEPENSAYGENVVNSYPLYLGLDAPHLDATANPQAFKHRTSVSKWDPSTRIESSNTNCLATLQGFLR